MRTTARWQKWRSEMGITLMEYNRRWDMIMFLFGTNRMTADEASDAIRELTAQHIWRVQNAN